MAVPGKPDSTPQGAPAQLAETELFAVDAYLASFEATVLEADVEQRRLLLSRTAFFPGGGGQPFDTGTLAFGDATADVVRVKREGGGIWHWVDGEADLPKA